MRRHSLNCTKSVRNFSKSSGGSFMGVVQAADGTQQAPQGTEQARSRNIIDDDPIFRLTDMFSRSAGQNGWVGEASEYLQAIRSRLEDSSAPVQASMQHISDMAVAFSTADKVSVVLVKEPDVVNVQALVNDVSLTNAKEAFYSNLSGYKLLNIVLVNRFMLQRPQQMAAYITQIIMAEMDESIREFNIDSFGNRYHINIDTQFTNVRSFYEANSTTPVIGGEFGFIASLLDKNDPRNMQFQQPVPMFAATGYVEFLRNPDGTFTPVVHVADILSVVASTKILAIAIPLIADIFISRGLWRHQFSAVGKDADINIGNLMVGPDQKPIKAENDTDIKQMFNSWIKPPILAMDIRAGHAGIPSLTKITRALDHDLLIRDIFQFLNAAPGSIATVGQNIFKEITGVLESARTGKFANYIDTRDLTYLYAVAKLKYSPVLDYLLTRADLDPAKRFEKLCAIFQELHPTHASITTLLDGTFIAQIAALSASKFNVNIPMISEIQSIDMNIFAAKAYQPGVPLFGQTGPSNMVGNGFIRF